MMQEISPVQLQFLGAARTVTGSKTLVQTERHKILIDCGLFQGGKPEQKLNKLREFPLNPASLNAIILTHGHLDHTGFLPALVKKGFHGPIYATPPTRDITEVILYDSAHIQEEEALQKNRRRGNRSKRYKPLYNEKHVTRTMKLFKTFDDREWVSVAEELRFRFHRSGHILGAVSVELEAAGKRFIFSGDLGQRAPLILDTPAPLPEADYIIMEATYGDRLHDTTTSPYQALQDVVNSAFAKGGTLIIPSFAVERAQEIILILNNLIQEKSIPALPIYLDSPMAAEVTGLFQKHRGWHNMTEAETSGLTQDIHLVQSFEETQLVLSPDGPRTKIIIAGSGMVTGGRSLYYLKHLLGNPDNTVLLVGYQAPGTRGQLLLDGAPALEIDGDSYEVRAEVRQISVLSAHGDQADLLWWLGRFKQPPQQVFLNHGEETAMQVLKELIEETFQYPVATPERNQVYTL
ncbi:MBL fold metallo-hydrolase [Pontibacter sp. E15-1]|uniref:MBL fold metallo-hydrolase RNA specificity domain-containing protein n=1 Tax=Pontibacter sp. E15-1 TaxID=2919918 RepID=UPI001F501687|nr:MBL fold metallo-hydrolase [Pontibacter sp. E15-1]MCJ8166273.1 MBL fold metallo-hydrolase [Pontibacter sp. E15-1]